MEKVTKIYPIFPSRGFDFSRFPRCAAFVFTDAVSISHCVCSRRLHNFLCRSLRTWTNREKFCPIFRRNSFRHWIDIQVECPKNSQTLFCLILFPLQTKSFLSIISECSPFITLFNAQLWIIFVECIIALNKDLSELNIQKILIQRIVRNYFENSPLFFIFKRRPFDRIYDRWKTAKKPYSIITSKNTVKISTFLQNCTKCPNHGT